MASKLTHSLLPILFLALACSACAAEGQSEPSGPEADVSVPAPYVRQLIDFPDGFNGATGCTIDSLAACSDTNPLTWDDGFRSALRNFVGERRRAFLNHIDGLEGPDETASLVADSVVEVLGGAPDDASRLGPYLLFSACRSHSCPEKGIAVLTNEGEIVALGILHYWNKLGEVGERQCCGRDPDLDIYFRAVDDWGQVLPSLQVWAEERGPLQQVNLHEVILGSEGD